MKNVIIVVENLISLPTQQQERRAKAQSLSLQRPDTRKTISTVLKELFSEYGKKEKEKKSFCPWSLVPSLQLSSYVHTWQTGRNRESKTVVAHNSISCCCSGSTSFSSRLPPFRLVKCCSSLVRAQGTYVCEQRIHHSLLLSLSLCPSLTAQRARNLVRSHSSLAK